jgi:hypothetical protein
VKIEHTRERLVSPRTRRVSTDAAIEGQRAAKHRLPGWKSSSRFAGRSDRPSFGTRPRGLLGSETGTLVGQRNGRFARRGTGSLRAPRLVFDLPRER